MANENARHERNASKGKRGSTNNTRRLDAFAKKVNGKGDADWGNADPVRLAAVVVAAQNMGGAVTFGLSRDGGAYMVTLLLDGERETLWFNGAVELDDELDTITETLKALET